MPSRHAGTALVRCGPKRDPSARVRTARHRQAKQQALEARGVRVGQTPTEVAEIAAQIAGSLAS